MDPDTLERMWGLKAVGLSTRVNPHSIVIPIYYRNRIVSWTTRKIGNGKGARYNSAKKKEEILHHKHLLYGEDYVRDTIIVTEGPFNVFRIGPGAVCTFGLSISQEQLHKIAKYPRRVFCLDATEQAQKVAQRLCEQLVPLEGETYNIELQDGKDPAETSDKEIWSIRKAFLE